MLSTRKSRLLEIAVVIVLGAIVSIINTLWLRDNLLKQVEKIAKKTEGNIVNSKVIDISTKMNS